MKNWHLRNMFRNISCKLCWHGKKIVKDLPADHKLTEVDLRKKIAVAIKSRAITLEYVVFKIGTKDTEVSLVVFILLQRYWQIWFSFLQIEPTISGYAHRDFF